MYVTRNCVERIGLMDERYFLYFEDLDWGLRAKRQGMIGHAHRSVVVHDGGTTIGGGRSRRGNSSLAVYLEFRNRLLFTRDHFPKWVAWTLLMEIVEIMEYARIGSFHNISGGVPGGGGGTHWPDGQTGSSYAVAPAARENRKTMRRSEGRHAADRRAQVQSRLA